MSSSDPLARARLAWVNGDAAGTIRAAQAWCNAPDPKLRVRALGLCGDALRQLGRLQDASRLLHAALAIDPHNPLAWTAIARMLGASGDYANAVNAWERVALRSPRDPTPWLELAELHRTAKDFAAASRASAQAALRKPDSLEIAIEAALDLRATGLELETLVAVERAIERFPRAVFFHLLAAELVSSLGRREDALAHLHQAVALDPHHVDARCRRVTHYIQTRQIDDAARDVEIMLELAPEQPQVRLQAARLATVRGDHDRALELLESLLQDRDNVTDNQQAHALLYRAEILGKRGEVEQEWRDLNAGQQLLARALVQTGEDGTQYLALLRNRAELMSPGSSFRAALATMPTTAPTGSALSERPPVFMFGFPRSGTTLFENVLGAHPSFTATDELNLLGAVLQSIATECGNPPIESLSDAQVRHLRAVFEQKAQRAGYDTKSTRLIDKNPLNFVFVDIVRKVFPDAPVVMIFRDPRDCVWSAFRQPFEPHASLILSRELTGTATLYATALELWQQARSLDGLKLLEVHYEHMVTDFEATARQLVEATGEAWHPAVLEFHQALGQRFVRTPSFAAVGQKVNRSRLASWTRHADKMAAVLPILQPFIDRYGVEAVLGSASNKPVG